MDIENKSNQKENQDASSSATAVTATSEVTLQQSTKPPRLFKVIVIGDSNVGKTCLTFRFCGGRFLEKSEATIGVDFREKQFEIEEERIKLQIWDTAGQERFRKSMISHYYRNVHAIVYVYDVTKAETFENLAFWIEESNKNVNNLNVPRILVGNKCDLVDECVVATNVAQRFADMHQMPLFETSARDDSNHDHVESIFMTVALKLKNSKQLLIPKEANKNLNRTELNSNGASQNSSNNNSGSNCSC